MLYQFSISVVLQVGDVYSVINSRSYGPDFEIITF